MKLIALVLLLVAGSAGAAGPIRVDQIGYSANAPKLAVVAVAENESAFAVHRAGDGAVVFEGSLSPARWSEASGESLRLADFSDLREPGRYWIRVAGLDPSAPFAISENPHQPVLKLAMRSYYGQRCGTAVDLAPTDEGYAHAACHATGAYHPSSGRAGAAPSIKGWHDAGDYGRYVVNGGIAVATLLLAWELYPEAFRELDLDIPESRDATPDVLDEIRWQLEWMLSMQDDDGGVWQKQTSTDFPTFVMPEDDPLVNAVIGTGAPPYKSTCATANLAGAAAMAARAWDELDPEFAARSLGAARRAFAWAREHPSILFRNPTGISTGEYGDEDCSDEIVWAAVEIWRTAADEEAERYLRASSDHLTGAIVSTAPPAWPELGALAAWSYALAPGADRDLAATIRSRSLRAARAIVTRMNEEPYRIPHVEDDWEWGSNGVAANYALQLMIANRFRPDAPFVDAALEILHYLLGRNPFSLSFVTGAGSDPALHPHHRPSGSDANAAPWPGLLVGGANRNRQDPVLRALPPQTPPMKMYADVEASYASNEIAINWNAPLVFVLAGVVADGAVESKK